MSKANLSRRKILHDQQRRRELARLRRQIQDPDQGATLAGQMLQDSAFLDYAQQHEADVRTSVRVAIGREGLVAVGRSNEDVLRVIDYIRDEVANKRLTIFAYAHPSDEELSAVEGLASAWSEILPKLPAGPDSQSTPETGDNKNKE
jgi:hypothetical protein